MPLLFHINSTGPSTKSRTREIVFTRQQLQDCHLRFITKHTNGSAFIPTENAGLPFVCWSLSSTFGEGGLFAKSCVIAFALSSPISNLKDGIDDGEARSYIVLMELCPVLVGLGLLAEATECPGSERDFADLDDFLSPFDAV